MSIFGFTKWWLGAALLAGGASAAVAQDLDASAMVKGGLQVVQMIDQGRTGELWDGAAAALKQHATRGDFVGKVASAREPMGAVQQRIWVTLTRQIISNSDPALGGQYVTIDFETRFAGSTERTWHELTTFHRDPDGTWRLSGYLRR